jgi:hypothetical protein
MDLSNISRCCSKNDRGRSRLIKVLEKYCKLDIEVRGRLEHCIDLISEMRKVLVNPPSITCEVDISAVWTDHGLGHSRLSSKDWTQPDP